GSSIICVFVPQITRIDRDVASPRKRSGRYRFRELSWPPHQGHSLRPRSRTSGLRTPESAEAPSQAPHASADSHLAPPPGHSSLVLYQRFWLNALRCTRLITSDEHHRR